MSPDLFAPDLAATLALAKAWALAQNASEIAPDAFLEAAMRLHPALVRGALEPAGLEGPRLARLEREAARRTVLDGADLPRIAACEWLCDALEELAQERAGAAGLTLSELLAELARHAPFLAWARKRYAPPAARAPLSGTRELLERLAGYHEVALRAVDVLSHGGRCAEGLLLDLAERGADLAARWAATPLASPVRELYARWELDAPLAPESAAVETALVCTLCPRPSLQPVSVVQLTRLVGLDAYPCDASRALAGLERALALGLVQRAPRLSDVDPCLEDRLIGTSALVLDVEAALRREPLDCAWRARARRRLWTCGPERGETT